MSQSRPTDPNAAARDAIERRDAKPAAAPAPPQGLVQRVKQRLAPKPDHSAGRIASVLTQAAEGRPVARPAGEPIDTGADAAETAGDRSAAAG